MERPLTLEKIETALPAHTKLSALRLAAGKRRVLTRKLLLAFHLSTVGLQIGVVAALVGLQLLTGFEGEVTRRAVLYDAVTVLEYFGLYPLVGLAILSGVILGIYAHSGFLTAWWLIVKQAAFGLVGVAVAIFIGPASPHLAELASQSRSLTPELENLHFGVTAALVFYVTMAVALVVLSVLKPWGKRR